MSREQLGCAVFANQGFSWWAWAAIDDGRLLKMTCFGVAHTRCGVLAYAFVGNAAARHGLCILLWVASTGTWVLVELAYGVALQYDYYYASGSHSNNSHFFYLVCLFPSSLLCDDNSAMIT